MQFSDEAAMVEFHYACRKNNSSEKVQALRKCLISGFSVPPLATEARHISDFINSLEGKRNTQPY